MVVDLTSVVAAGSGEITSAKKAGTTPLLPRSQGTSGEQLGRYRLGGDVAVQPEDGGAISVADYALEFVDLVEKGDHRRAQVNLGH